jgi:SAM-dependent methyltransferase
MQRGFPLQFLHLVRCAEDGGELRAIEPAAGGFIVDGAAACAACGQVHRIESGILSLLGAVHLHRESEKELQQRDIKNASILSGERTEWASSTTDAIEVNPTLAAVSVAPGMTVLEIGCGPGRYTLDLARRAVAVVAVDFSRQGLLVLRRKLDPEAPVALVQADVTRPYAAPAAFDRVLSTLHSNLPDTAHRSASLHHIARAMKVDGRAVISMHHLSGRDRLKGVPAAGRYPDNGMFRYYMTSAEARREGAPFFSRIRLVHISAGIPGVRSATVGRLVARLPLLRSALSRLFLAVSEGPRLDRAHGGERIQRNLPRAEGATQS